MPFVRPDEALDSSFVDLESLSDRFGPPPWRVALVATQALRVVVIHWPPGYATVRHHHPRADEIFLILRGRAAFAIGDEPEREAEAGQFVYARRGVRHAIRVPAGAPVLLLASVAPNEDEPDEAVE